MGTVRGLNSVEVINSQSKLTNIMQFSEKGVVLRNVSKIFHSPYLEPYP